VVALKKKITLVNFEKLKKITLVIFKNQLTALQPVDLKNKKKNNAENNANFTQIFLTAIFSHLT
jgi:hypothetical protein